MVMSIITPNPTEVQSIEKALLGAYGLAAFKMMLYHHLGIRLEEEVDLHQGSKFVVRDFVDLAIRGGWLEPLVRASLAGQPGNFTLKAIAKDLGVALDRTNATADTVPLAASEPALEKLIRSRSTLLNFDEFLTACDRLTHRLCTIEIPTGNAIGTGWLVAPDLILTNHHVTEALELHHAAPEDVACVFDRRDTQSTGNACGLAADWRVASSPTAPEDVTVGGREANTTELDYALVRLSRSVGHDPIAASGEERGWIALKDNPPAVVANDVVMILQHPDGRPLEVAFGNILAYNGASTRIRYDANTDAGSSGSPCLTINLEPFALHNGGAPGGEKYNKGIPLRRIIEHLKTQSVSPIWT